MKYGKDAALRQWRGLFTGFATVSMCAVLVTYFLGEAFHRYVGVLSWIGAAYIAWLAIHILFSKPTEDNAEVRSCSFLSGLLVQLTNVKIMVFCLTALSSFVLPYTGSFWWLMAVGIILPFTGPVANLAWIFAGTSLQKLFVKHQKVMNVCMAISLLLCSASICANAL